MAPQRTVGRVENTGEVFHQCCYHCPNNTFFMACDKLRSLEQVSSKQTAGNTTACSSTDARQVKMKSQGFGVLHCKGSAIQ